MNASGSHGQTPAKLEVRLEPVTGKVHHLLVSASYQSDERVLGGLISKAIEDVFHGLPAEPVQIVVYTTTVCVPPSKVSLTDAWQQLTDDERHYVYTHMPCLFTAIFLAIKGITPPEKQCDEVSPHGEACTVKGPHTAHVSKRGHDGRVSSEVWT